VGILTFFIEVVRGVMHVVDSIVTPASALVTFNNITGIDAFQSYFYNDSPINFVNRISTENSYQSEVINKVSCYYIFFQNVTNVPVFEYNTCKVNHTLNTLLIPQVNYNTFLLTCTNDFITNLESSFITELLTSKQIISNTNSTSTFKHYAFTPVVIDISSFF